MTTRRKEQIEKKFLSLKCKFNDLLANLSDTRQLEEIPFENFSGKDGEKIIE
jgi:hypothetical protein